MGIYLAAGGAAALIVGAALWAGFFAWFERLPPQVQTERDNARVCVPLASMLLVSLGIGTLLFLALRWP